MDASWSLRAEVPAPESDAASAVLFEAGAVGVEEREPSLVPMPGASQPSAGRVLLVAYFAGRDDAERAAADLAVPAVIERVEERDWGEEWKKGLAPFAVGRVFIRPSWIAATPPPGTVEVVLDPGMAFGTGTHPTTALCLGTVDEVLLRVPGARVLDVGTGSGLLAIAARKLGSRRVVAIDVDPISVRVATENAARNGVSVEIGETPLREVEGAFGLVVANILANVLVELAPDLAARLEPRGELVLAGLLVAQEGEVRSAFSALGLRELAPRREGEWSLLRFERPEP
ncbi:MAG TPA: 50S ribosomal protein L11 methyltransferase [Anaeromyxobacteraceae bacterium]|nr:50S ribosomal protein L11 methyltransferase [Anaeromyxobacteraceae bacterium]